MTNNSIYKDISERTGGNIYIGVVGPVRTGKSTFIKRFMETLVIPHIDDIYLKERARDELPQSGSGKTIMTAEPKFIPENAAQICLDEHSHCNVRLVDCVGFMVPGANGQMEDGNERMVMTPWHESEISISRAAEEGTAKVINEHSTIGIFITTDGSICGLPRENYIAAEEKTAAELNRIGKPYVILLNSAYPESPEVAALSAQLSENYGAPCIPINCLELCEEDIKKILSGLLSEFPFNKIDVYLPSWADALDCENELKQRIFSRILDSVDGRSKLKDIGIIASQISECEDIGTAEIDSLDFGLGCAELRICIPQQLYYKTLSEESGFEINDDGDLVALLRYLNKVKSEYDRVHEALDEVRRTGYGIVLPTFDEMSLEEPQIVKQGSRYGVKLKASAPSIHMIMTNVETEVSPAVGGEKASDEILNFLIQGFDGDVNKIWESNIFGKSLYDIASEGLMTKIRKMPDETQSKMQDTLQKIINEGCNGLICIML